MTNDRKSSWQTGPLASSDHFMSGVGGKRQSSIMRPGELCLGNARGCLIKSQDLRVECFPSGKKGKELHFHPSDFFVLFLIISMKGAIMLLILFHAFKF